MNIGSRVSIQDVAENHYVTDHIYVFKVVKSKNICNYTFSPETKVITCSHILPDAVIRIKNFVPQYKPNDKVVVQDYFNSEFTYLGGLHMVELFMKELENEC